MLQDAFWQLFGSCNDRGGCDGRCFRGCFGRTDEFDGRLFRFRGAGVSGYPGVLGLLLFGRLPLLQMVLVFLRPPVLQGPGQAGLSEVPPPPLLLLSKRQKISVLPSAG